MLGMLTELMSGLALFLFGMKFMSESLQKAAGDQMRGILNRVTSNKIVAVIFGALFTAFIQSSGATTVMEVSFVNVGMLSLEQSVGITFGANIGTTITSQLVSLKLTAIAPYIIFLGSILLMFGKGPLVRKISEVIFGFGALFLGINSMTAALSQIPEFPEIMQWFTYLKNPFIALIVGLVFTVAVQSSSVTVSVLVLLADTGLVGFVSCLYFILGANIGSCTPAVMAGMNANKDAKRTALIHLLFNVLGMVVIGTILIFAREPIINMIAAINGPDNYKRFVANADTIFKTFQCIIFLPISNLLVKLTKVLVKDAPNTNEELDSMTLEYIGKAKNFLPATAVVESIQEMNRMAKIARMNLIDAMDGFMNKSADNLEIVTKREEVLDYLSSQISDYLVEVNRYELPLSDTKRIGGLFHVIIDLERIGDHAMNIMENAVRRSQQKMDIDAGGKEEMREMFRKVLELYDSAIQILVTQTDENLNLVMYLENEIDQMDIDLQKHQVDRTSKGLDSVESGLIFTDMVIGLERIADHSTNIAYSILRSNPEDEQLPQGSDN